MHINRRTFIATSSIGTAGLVLPTLGGSLSLSEIRSDPALRHVYDAVSTYGTRVRMSKQGSTIQVTMRVEDHQALLSCYSRNELAGTRVRAEGPRMKFVHKQTPFVVTHQA